MRHADQDQLRDRPGRLPAASWSPLRRIRSRGTPRSRRPRDERGQSLVEFALILPIFVMLLLGLMEFAITFSTLLNINFASRDATLIAAEAGDGAGADCAILQMIEKDLDSPTQKARIQQVRIYWSGTNGNELAANVYLRSGSTTCSYPNGTSVTVPYTASATGYPESARCTVINGCGASHPGLDTVGVRIAYRHTWLTPLPAIVQLPAGGIDITRSNAMRMEPTL